MLSFNWMLCCLLLTFQWSAILIFSVRQKHDPAFCNLLTIFFHLLCVSLHQIHPLCASMHLADSDLHWSTAVCICVQLAEGLERFRNDACIVIWDVKMSHSISETSERSRYSSSEHGSISRPHTEIGSPWFFKFCFFFCFLEQCRLWYAFLASCTSSKGRLEKCCDASNCL